MTASKVTGVKRAEFLLEIGVGELEGQDIKRIADRFATEVNIGWNRPRNVKPVFSDGGLYSVKTGIEPITPREWGAVSEGLVAIAATYAGTNWMTTFVRKENGQIKVLVSSAKLFTPEKREYKFAEIAGFMASEIEKVIKEAEKKNFINTSEKLSVGISFGFFLKSAHMDYGIDASLGSSKPSKNWVIRDWKEDQFYGLEIIKFLMEKYKRELGYIYFDNDTKMVANNINGSVVGGNLKRVGFVFGTGVNSCEGEVNYESGISSHALDTDRILTKMFERKLVGVEDNIMEYWMGGDHLKSRAAMAFEIMDEEKLIDGGRDLGDYILKSNDGAVISKIASADYITMNKLAEMTDDAGFVSGVCKKVLAMAGQLMGIQIAVISSHAGYSGGIEQIPVEGSVYHRGFGVKEKAREVIDLLIPGNGLKITDASSLLGAGQFAMVRSMNMK